MVTVVDTLLNKFKLISRDKRKQIESKWINNLKIKTSSADMPASSLSGGNQQRVVLAKWLATNLKLFILDGPTIGIDIASKKNIHDIIRDFAREGGGDYFDLRRDPGGVTALQSSARHAGREDRSRY